MGSFYRTDPGARPWGDGEAGLRPVPHHDARQLRCRHGAREREPSVVEGGRPDPQGKQVHLALPRGDPIGRYQNRFAALQALHLKTGRAYALKEVLAEFWDYKSPGLGEKLLETVVLLGHPLSAQADEEGGRDDRGPSGNRDELLHAPHHERGGEGVEPEDRHHPEDGPWVPHQVTL